ncbi:MAG: ATP-binding cassette domain-containing protein [Desulfovibrionales bacterium]
MSSHPGATPVLAAEGVSKRFGTRWVLQEITFSLGAGEVMLVVGPNGAGKSTLLKILSGAITPAGGIVTQSVPRDQIAYMGHRTFLYPRLTTLENLRFWATLYGRRFSKDQAVTMLKRTGLVHVLHEEVGHFSRGMAQRLSLARMLLIDPMVLLLDEPGTGLDPGSRTILAEEIGAARDRGKSVIWVSHDPERDAGLADRILALESKRVAYLGEPKPYVQEALGGC